MRVATGMAVAIALCACQSNAVRTGQAGTADLSGIWLPDARRAQAWPAELPLAPAARSFMERFDPAANDPVTYCMPLGTPRNMLQTGYPLEIAQTPQRLVMIIQPNLANAEVRRVPLDGSELPADAEPSWYGTSRGHWEGATLVIETTGLREDAIISENGLPHSDALRVVERLWVVNDAQRGKVLIDDIELRDPQAYLAPLKIRRYYSWAPQARVSDSACVEAKWSEKLWRDRLEEHAREARGENIQ